MKRDKFVQDAKADPGRFYRNPSDVARDRRLTKADRLEILDIWEQREQDEPSAGASAEEESRLGQIRRIRREIADNQTGAGAG